MLRFIAFIIVAQLAFADGFADYWYAGKSEVAVYDLQQSRYGEMRAGTATLIFVTEPFSKKKHVKLDDPSKAKSDATTVLKLNMVKKYNTGIYPYSVMSSGFADVNTGQLYKATTSIQEWCGHVFMQANSTGKNDYKYQGFSYFESEGDESGTLKNTALAEELMLKIRLEKLDPSMKELKLVPSQEMLRLLHIAPASVAASLSWTETDKTRTLSVNYENAMEFETVITYSKEFPHVIQSWSESFTKGGKRHTSTAKLKTVQMLPYWSMNSSRYDKVRKEIGLE